MAIEEGVVVLDEDKEAEKTGLDVSGTSTGSGNGVAVNAAGSKVTLGVGELNSSKGAGAQISNVQGDINFGNVKTAKSHRFDNLPSLPDTNQPNNEQELSR